MLDIKSMLKEENAASKNIKAAKSNFEKNLCKTVLKNPKSVLYVCQQ